MVSSPLAAGSIPSDHASDLAIDLSHVSKVYSGGVHALQGIEMRVRRGEIFGLLGPNGAGKSTLVKILLTVIRPTTANGTMLGNPVGHKPTLARVGYLPEHHRFPEYLTGAQVIDFYGALAKTPRQERRRRSAELLELVGMKDWANKRVRGYSKGMRQRVGIAQALINNPDLVVLDEPTDGVDPVGRRDIRGIVSRLRDEGRSVFVNSHLLSELEMVCDRVAILVQGKVATQGTIDELTRHRIYYEISVQMDERQAQGTYRQVLQLGPGAADGIGREILPWTRDAQTPTTCTFSGAELKVATSDPQVIQPIIDALRERGVVIRQVRFVRPSLEDLFMEVVTDPLTGAALPPGAATINGKRRNGGEA